MWAVLLSAIVYVAPAGCTLAFSKVLFTLVGQVTIVLLTVVPMATLESRQPLPSGAPVPASFEQSTRCYELHFRPSILAPLAPRRVRLHDAPSLDLWRDALADTGSRGSDTRQAAWVMAGPDSVDVMIPFHWYMGVQIRLPATNGTLAGRAWAWEDTPAVTPGPDVEAIPRSCR